MLEKICNLKGVLEVWSPTFIYLVTNYFQYLDQLQCRVLSNDFNSKLYSICIECRGVVINNMSRHCVVNVVIMDVKIKLIVIINYILIKDDTEN